MEDTWADRWIDTQTDKKIERHADGTKVKQQITYYDFSIMVSAEHVCVGQSAGEYFDQDCGLSG
jgi:hypothetical protein